MIDLSQLHFDAAGLIPAVAQESGSGEVLLLAFMNEEALRLTMETGLAHFWSRSRGTLWRKGETSGNTLQVERVAVNCEQNSLLLTVRLSGPVACHDGYRTCFYRALRPDGALERIQEPGSHPRDEALACDIAALYASYLRLRDEDFTATSQTSRLLRDPATTVDFLLRRAKEELAELAGVLGGTHQHEGGRADVLLEASQANYWLCLAAILLGCEYSRWQPHHTLLDGWYGRRPLHTDREVDHLLAELGRLLAQAGVHPAEPVAADLARLRERLERVEGELSGDL